MRHIIEEKPSSKEQRLHDMKEYDMFKKPRKSNCSWRAEMGMRVARKKNCERDDQMMLNNRIVNEL